MNRLSRIICTILLLVPSRLMASGEGGGTHLPDLLGLFLHGEVFEYWRPIIYAFAISVFLSTVAVQVYRKRQMVPGRFQSAMELLIESMFNFLESILGKNARKYTPFLGTLFFYILSMNFMGIIPLGMSPSTSINVTASLAIMVFLYAQYTGIRRLGIVGYIDHLAGQPRDLTGWCLLPLMFPIHVIGELAKPFSLSLRLFGNITGEDILVAAFVGLGITALSFIPSPVGLPLNVPFILLGILLSTIQALVFTLLSSIYILMMLPHEEHS